MAVFSEKITLNGSFIFNQKINTQLSEIIDST